MKIAIDISPIEGKSSVQHRVRGTGFYVRNLKEALLKYGNQNEYKFFTRGEKLLDDIDLVHYPYFEPFFLTLPFFNKSPLVATVHDLTPLVFPKYFKTGLKGKFKWKIQKASLRKAKRIITDSVSSKKDIIKYTGITSDKIDVAYLAPGENFKKKNLSLDETDKLRKKYNLPKEFALYVGDVTWNKNLPRLIEACLSTNIPLVMTGKALLNSDFDKKNSWNQDLVKVRELCEGKKNIIRVGFVNDEDLVNFYNITQVFIMPSLYEGFGLPILEAMACGVPVITSKEGSLPEVAGEAAYYVDAYSVDTISNGVRKVFSDSKLRKELSEKGLKQAQKFSWKKTAEETLRVYEKAIKNL